MGKSRIKSITINNFRCIGPNPVTIEIDDIVVLVGPNNVGKSSILRAYEVIMSQGSSAGSLTIEDFPKGEPKEGRFPEITLVTVVEENLPGDEWLRLNEDNDKEIKERWIWEAPGKPKRQGFLWETNCWDDKVPWGAPNVANSRRPEPHRVSAFDQPEKQAEEIIKILTAVLKDRLENLKPEERKEKSDYQELLEKVKHLKRKLVKDAEKEIKEIESEIESYISLIFPKYKVSFDPKIDEGIEDSVELFTKKSVLKMGASDDYLSTLELQGSGARRTLLWSALKIASERNRKEGQKSRPHVLLLDEPEICLHPNAIREACNVLYNLPNSGNWQIIITTHSPCFIDFSRDNTSIVRVYKDNSGTVSGTTIFRPSRARFTDDDKLQLKLLNLCDPHVAEFFFGGSSVVVEGDTEYSVFNYLKSENIGKYSNTHIIRARGKATIVSVMKILNQFGSRYSVLHDLDAHEIHKKDGTKMVNPAWTNNFKILEEYLNNKNNVKLNVCRANFENAFSLRENMADKPYEALVKLKKDAAIRGEVEKLLDALVFHSDTLPENVFRYGSEDELNSLKMYEIPNTAPQKGNGKTAHNTRQ